MLYFSFISYNSPLIVARLTRRFTTFIFQICIFFFAAISQAQVIEDIRIEGLQRVSADAVFAVLPLDIGDSITEERVAELIKSVFSTGSFQDIQVGIDEQVLVINVIERPSISEISIEGNKAIKSEALLDGLRSQGMAEGRVFERATLDGLRRELARQYGAQGRYDAEITTDVSAQPRNRVAIDILVDEGKPAKIKDITIVGNQAFSDKTLRRLIELKDRGWRTFFNGKRKYAREKLTGDIESIKDYYLDRGYIAFEITSVQVSIGPKKNSVYISIVVDEGEQFKVAKVGLAGDVKEQAGLLERAYLIGKGQTFSQAYVTRTEELMKKIMGNQGYTFAEVKSIPEINEQDKTVDVTFFIEPGKRTYIRRIEFAGNNKTNDEVLRREMRIQEQSIASTDTIEQSRRRLDRLGFFENVSVETPAVAGTDDLIDVKFSVEEQPSGSVSASVGFSQDVGIIFGANFQQNNFLGSGKQVNLQANRSRFRTNYSLSYVNPYYTPDGVSRGFSIFFRETDFEEINVSSFSTNSAGGSVIFGYPIAETQSVRFSLGYTRTQIETGFAAVQEIKASPLAFSDLEPGIAFKIEESLIDSNIFYPLVEDPALGLFQTTPADFSISEPGFVDVNGELFDVFSLNATWRESTLNRGIFPTRGHSNNVSFEITTPGSDVEYYKVSLNSQYYFPLTRRLTLRLRGEFGYGDGLDGLDRLPFYENYFSGGIGSVRGFESNTLGPRSSPARSFDGGFIPVAPGQSAAVYLTNPDGSLMLSDTFDRTPDPFGGNFLTEGSMEIILPTPFVENSRSVRTVLFYDVGNVFDDNCRSTQTDCSAFRLSDLRSAVGLSLTWLSGFGPLSFSIGVPLEEQDGDETEFFQFTLGGGF